MKCLKLIICFSLSSILATAAAASGEQGKLHTENNEVVCQMPDLLKTRLFVDSDAELDGKIGVLSSKVLEMPTENARANNFRLFQTKLVKVFRPRCPHCKDTQIILYQSEGDEETINKLEVTATSARITRGVDQNGNTTKYSVVDSGPCAFNEPY